MSYCFLFLPHSGQTRFYVQVDIEHDIHQNTCEMRRVDKTSHTKQRTATDKSDWLLKASIKVNYQNHQKTEAGVSWQFESNTRLFTTKNQALRSTRVNYLSTE